MKKIILVLCILALIGSGAQAAVSARLGHAAVLLDETGRELTKIGLYEDIVDLGNGLFAAQLDGAYALMDSRGMMLTQPIYRQLRWDGGLLLAQRGNSWGILRTDGSIRSAFEYSVIVPTGRGGAWALRGDPNDAQSDRLFLLDNQGRETQTGLFVRALGTVGGEGLLPVLLSASGWWGYCNGQGSVVISGEYSYAGPFIGGRAVIVENGRYGAIDAQGEIIADPDYDFLQISPAGFLLAARTQEGAWAMNLNGAEIATYMGEDVSAALVGNGYIISDSQSLRLYDAQGALIAQLAPDASILEGIDGAYLLSTGAWGEACVQLLGTQNAYQNLYPLGKVEGQAVYACLEVNTARSVYDLLGEIQLSVDMDTARYGIVDADGTLRIPCNYESIEFLGNGRFLTRNGSVWQMIDLDGQVYWEFTQTEAPNS